MKKYQKNFEECVKQIIISLGWKEEELEGYLFGVNDVIKDWSFIELDEIYEEGLGEGYSILSNEMYAVAAGYALLTHYGLDEKEYRKWAKKQTDYNEYLLAIVDGLTEKDKRKSINERERVIYETINDEFSCKKKLIKFVEHETDHALFDKKIEIDSRLKDIVKLVAKFQEIEDFSITILEKGLNDRCKEYKECAQNIVSVLKDGVDANWVKCKRYLKSLSVPDETIDTIYEAYKDVTKDVYVIKDYLYDALMDLKEMAEGKIEKIVAKSKHRKEMEFQGGGIGIGSAVAGMIGAHIACSVNASIADFQTKKSAESLRKELEKAANEIYLGAEAKSVYKEIIKFANQELRELCMVYLYGDAVETSVDIAETFKKLHAENIKNSVTEEQLKILYSQILFTYPWEKAVYEEIITTYGIDPGIDELAQYIGVDISKIKRKRLQKEKSERTEDGIVFATVEDKAVYIQERDLFEPLLEEIKQINIWDDKQKFVEKFDELKKMNPPTVKQLTERRDKVLRWCEERQANIDSTNGKYLSEIMKVALKEWEDKTIVREGYSNYNSLLNYFEKIIQFDKDERIILFVTSYKENPSHALIFGIKYIYHYTSERYFKLEYQELCDIRYIVEKGTILNDKVAQLKLIFSNGNVVDVTKLFSSRTSNNYYIKDKFVSAIRECIKINKNVGGIELKKSTYANSESIKDNYSKELVRKMDMVKEQYPLSEALDKMLKVIPQIKKPIDDALSRNDVLFVWEEIGKKNIYAEYAMEKYYDFKCKKCISDCNIAEMNRILSDVINRAEKGDVFAQYLQNSLEHSMYRKAGKEGLKESTAHRILTFANKGNVSAIALKGFWGTHGYYNATATKSAGLKYLEMGAKDYHPTALAWLGNCYKNGDCGLSIDKAKAKFYYSLAAEYGQIFAKEELKKMNNSSASSSSCFITTAVCNSFGKPDDCYELTSFRNYRDNWLVKQTSGEQLIKEYYTVAPAIVKAIDTQEDASLIYKVIWEKYLRKCLEYIETEQFEKCKALYMEMVNAMKAKYLG